MAIDGPSGSGKTTVSKRLAQRARLTRLDTGAMYRACALAAQWAGIPWSDGERLGRMCAGLAIEFRGEGEEIRVILSGKDVSDAIRTPGISMGASEVSAHPPVREAMVALQQKMGEGGGVILEGRDTGTVVFPDADAKFFLDAHAAIQGAWLQPEGYGSGAGIRIERSAVPAAMRHDIERWIGDYPRVTRFIEALYAEERHDD